VSRRHLGAISVLAALIAVLLPAGVLAATTVDSKGPALDRRVGAAGFAQGDVVDEVPAPAVTPTVASTAVAPPPVSSVAPPPVTSVPPPPAVTAPTTTTPPPRRATTATTALPASTSTTTATLLPGLPLPGLPPLPILQPSTNSWSSSGNGVTAHLRMEPAAPMPGQRVQFFLDVEAPEACCAMNLSYGDGVVSPNPPGSCDSPTTREVTLTHTFTSPGDYELFLIATIFPCKGKVVDGVFVPPPLYGVAIKACITVGLRLIGQPTCAPFNHFGPGTVYSAA